MRTKTYALILTTFLVGGCATLTDSLLLGATSGAVIGTFTGAVSPTYGSSRVQTTNISTGIAIGVGVGVIGAYILHKQMEDRESKIVAPEHDPKVHFGELPPNPFTPSLAPPATN